MPLHSVVKSSPADGCFRCGKPLSKTYSDCGQTCYSGFYTANTPAYYNTWLLCEDCHRKLTGTITNFLFEIKDGQ